MNKVELSPRENQWPFQSISRFLWHFVKRHKGIFLFQSALCLVWSVKEAFFPYFIKLIIDRTHNAGSVSGAQFIMPFFALVLIWTAMEIAVRLQAFIALKAFPRFRADIRSELFGFFLDLSYQRINLLKRGVVINLINQIPNASQTVLETFMLHFVSIFGAMLIIILLMYSASPIFAVLMIVWLALHLLLTFVFMPRILKAGLQQGQEQDRLEGHVSNVFSHVYNVFLFSKRRHEKNILQCKQEEDIKLSAFAQKQIENMRVFQGVLAVMYITSMLMFTYRGLSQHWLTLGDAALVPILSFNSLGMLWWLTQEINVCYRESNRIRSLFKFVSQLRCQALVNDKDAINKVSSLMPSSLRGEIVWDAVSFSYGRELVFQDFDLRIPAQQSIGVVGLSGAGKTSFTHLLLNLYRPTKGAILLDGRDLQRLSDQAPHQDIALVPQEILLFNRSIFSNICYGMENSNEEIHLDDVISAAKLAQCHDFIAKLPSGYDTLLGDQDASLSKGQQQRIVIARALLMDAAVFVFDEATSHLDMLTERRVYQGINDKLLHQKTLIFITHRVQMLKQTDRILVFESGRIVEEGDYCSLVKAKGRFYQFLKTTDQEGSHEEL